MFGWDTPYIDNMITHCVENVALRMCTHSEIGWMTLRTQRVDEHRTTENMRRTTAGFTTFYCLPIIIYCRQVYCIQTHSKNENLFAVFFVESTYVEDFCSFRLAAE